MNIWDFWAVRYEKLWVQKYSLAPTRRLVINKLRTLTHTLQHAGSLNVLDVGCGTGQLLEEIVSELGPCFSTLTGVDTARTMLDLAVRKNIPQAHFSYGNAEALPFTSAQFDLITCCHSFPYYRNQLQALRDFKRVLKSEGYLLIISASENTFYDKLVMALIKLTTGRANYPSSNNLAGMLDTAGFRVLSQPILKKALFFMPNIVLTIGQPEMEVRFHENLTYTAKASS
jgi:ubiquinone/menaquinone biosynthesis C-methylase UbiE